VDAAEVALHQANVAGFFVLPQHEREAAAAHAFRRFADFPRRRGSPGVAPHPSNRDGVLLLELE
jgi:hypothetical protein